MTEEQEPYDPRAHTMRLSGKLYLGVAGRIEWFNSEHQSFQIESDIVELTETHALFRAKVTTLSEGGVIIATAVAHGSESKGDFGDFIEKAETKALGRALGRLGYGTPEDDGAAQGRPVDAPREAPAPDDGMRCSLGHRFRDGPYGLQCTGKKPDGSWHNEPAPRVTPPSPPPPPAPPRQTKAELAANAKASINAQQVWEDVKAWAAEHGTDPQRLRYYMATAAGVPEKVSGPAFTAWLGAVGPSYEDLYRLYVEGEQNQLESDQKVLEI